MKAIPFPQANKVLKAPESDRSIFQRAVDDAARDGADVRDVQATLDQRYPPEAEQEIYDLPVWGGEVEGIERCISCWEPSPEERARIAAGGPIWLCVVGHTHPPLVLDASLRGGFDARGSTEDEAVSPAADLVAPPPGEG